MIAACTCPRIDCAIHGDRTEGVVTVSGNVSPVCFDNPPVYLSPDWSRDRAWKRGIPSLSRAVAAVIERSKQEPPHPITETM